MIRHTVVFKLNHAAGSEAEVADFKEIDYKPYTEA